MCNRQKRVAVAVEGREESRRERRRERENIYASSSFSQRVIKRSRESRDQGARKTTRFTTQVRWTINARKGRQQANAEPSSLSSAREKGIPHNTHTAVQIGIYEGGCHARHMCWCWSLLVKTAQAQRPPVLPLQCPSPPLLHCGPSQGTHPPTQKYSPSLTHIQLIPPTSYITHTICAHKHNDQRSCVLRRPYWPGAC